MTILSKAINMFNAIPIKIPDIPHSNLKINHKVHMEAQKTTNNQDNTKQTEQCCKYNNSWLQTILRSYCNKKSMIQAQKQTWRPMKQNKRPKYEPMQLCPPDFWQRCQKHTMEKRHPLRQMLGKLHLFLQKTEIKSLPFILYKYQLKVD
jgi:hypothetical protein